MSIIIGANQSAAHSGALGSGTTPMYFWQSFIASAGGTLTSLSINFYSAPSTSSSTTLAIYSAAGASLLGQTNSFAAATGVNTVNLQSGVTINSGTSYILAGFCAGNYPQVYTDGSATVLEVENGGYTYGTLPTSLANNDNTTGVMAMWGTASGGGIIEEDIWLVIPVECATL